ncbi:MAG: 50S ribosomal protein L28 [Chloroflexi bacterium]|nr:50S ribosomal protein L28 [Chloroflexota bacterium]
MAPILQGGYAVAKCELCNKVPRFGRNVSHSKVHTPRQFKPNIHPVHLMINGKRQRMKICTRCLRTQHKIAS